MGLAAAVDGASAAPFASRPGILSSIILDPFHQ
jgi:hypothetical protein